MDKFDDILEFIAGYSEEQPEMDLQAFEQLKETMTSYLEIEGLVADAENLFTRIFKSYNLSFLRAGVIVDCDRDIIRDLECIEQFIEIVDKIVILTDSKAKELDQKSMQVKILEKEVEEFRFNYEKVSIRGTSAEDELRIISHELLEAIDKINGLEAELNMTKSNNQDTVDHLQSLYNEAIQKKQKCERINSVELTDLVYQKNTLESDLSGAKEELELLLKSSSSTSHKLNVSTHELSTIRAEYVMIKDKYLRLTIDHQSEVRAY